MREIALTQGKKAMVDDNIYHLLENVPFHAAESKGVFYARSNRTLLVGKPNTYLHWIVVAPSFRKDFQIRFKDGNTLNCQRDNLEYIEKTLNTQINSKYNRKKSSKYIGVSKHREKWAAIIKHDGKVYRLGRYLTQEEAAQSYNKKAAELFGENAKTNKITTP